MAETMNPAIGHEAVENLRSATLTLLNDLVAHKIKGANVLIDTLNEVIVFGTEASTWYDELKALLIALKPFFAHVREWLVEAYGHLVQVFDWAKEMWHKLIGTSK